MHEVIIPQEDANSDSCLISKIVSPNLTSIKDGDVLFEVETSKAVYEILAEVSGYVVYDFEEGYEAPFVRPVGFIVGTKQEAVELNAKLQRDGKHKLYEQRITVKARQIADKHGIDHSQIKKKGVITEKDIIDLISPEQRDSFLEVEDYPYGIKKVLVIGAGFGAHQVFDILREHNDCRVIGLLDDDKSKKGKLIWGCEVLGSTKDLSDFYNRGLFTHAIIAVSGDIHFRKLTFEKCRDLGVPMVNAIDKSCNIRSNVSIGQGNVICGNTYIGSFTQLGDNNFISASTNIDHHNVWHSHISIGPNCATSAMVEVMDGCRFGTGVFIEPNVVIGRSSTLASGAIIMASVPANMLVKVKFSLIRTKKPDRDSHS